MKPTLEEREKLASMRDELLQNAWAYWHDDPAIEFLNRLLPEFPPFVPEHMSGDATAAPASLVTLRRVELTPSLDPYDNVKPGVGRGDE